MYRFAFHGHPHIRAQHKTTIELTTDAHLTQSGDCIVGVSAAFSLPQLQRFLTCKRVRITLEADGEAEEIAATPNPAFSDEKEMVIRLGSFASARTFATDADKASLQMSRALVAKLAQGATGTCTIECL